MRRPASQAKAWLGCRGAGDDRRHVIPEHRTELEGVARSSAHDPDVVQRRMLIDHEMLVDRQLVLADARVHEGRMRQPREAHGDEAAYLLDALGAHQPLAPVRIELRTELIHADLERAALDDGRAV